MESVSASEAEISTLQKFWVADIKMGVLGIPPWPWSRAVDFFGVCGDQMEQLGEGIRLPEFCLRFVHFFARKQECSGLKRHSFKFKPMMNVTCRVRALSPVYTGSSVTISQSAVKK